MIAEVKEVWQKAIDGEEKHYTMKLSNVTISVRSMFVEGDVNAWRFVLYVQTDSSVKLSVDPNEHELSEVIVDFKKRMNREGYPKYGS